MKHRRYTPVNISFEERFNLLAFPEPNSGCWLWTGIINNWGYGLVGIVKDGRKTTAPVHRMSYELFVGPIPDGLYIDHTCVNRACVNPAHLEPVTNKVNIQRAHAKKKACKQGHPFDNENTYRPPAGNGAWRTCRTCVRESLRRSYARRRAALKAAS